MFTLNDHRQAKQVITTAESLGAKLPTPVTAAYERATRIIEACKRLGPGQEALAVAVTAALDAGNDPAADPEVARVHLAAQLGNRGVEQGVEAIVSGQMTEVWAAHADAIVRAFTRPFEKAAATVVSSHQHIGDHPLDDTAAILRKGGTIGETWGKAKDAVSTIVAVDAAWVALAHVTHFAAVDKRYAVLRIAAVPADQWTTPGVVNGAWDVALAGLDLALADGPEYRRRVAAVQPVAALPREAA